MASSSPPPRRRFLPEPVETTTKSSRRFAPQPVETTTKSNRVKPPVDAPDASQNTARRKPPQDSVEATNNSSTPTPPRRFLPHPVESTTKTSRRFLPEPVETTTKSSRQRSHEDSPETAQDLPKRKFVPEPIETSTKSSHSPTRKVLPQPIESTTKSSRRFTPEPVETTTRSRRHKESNDTPEDPPRRRFLPEPVESSRKSNKKGAADPESAEDDSPPNRRTLPQPLESSTRSSRQKFAPQLIETAKRSFKQPPSPPPFLQSDKTETSPEFLSHLQPGRPPPIPIPPQNTPVGSSEFIPQISESRFSAASIASRAREKETRQHSFRVPDLPTITSTDSEDWDDKVPSLSTSASASSSETSSHKHKVRESCDERFSGYLLSLAARAAEKQLRDQAMAAYPNEHIHEPIDHFAIDSDEESEDPRVSVPIKDGDMEVDVSFFRRESAGDLGLELKALRKHHEKVEKQKRDPKEQELKATQGAFRAPPGAAQGANANDHTGDPKNIIGGWQKGVGLAQMRNAASPPMLGDDLVFPKSLSPKMTRCDVDQLPVPRTDANGEPSENEAQLWTAGMKNEKDRDSGLWMGVCKKTDQTSLFPAKKAKSGLMTPAIESDDPVMNGFAIDKLDMRQLPPSPPDSQDSRMEGIDKMLHLEQEIDREFHDGFITQIYNYLSLGYPSLAHQFDFELSKISRISVEELRKDDLLANAKGHVGAPEGDGVTEDGVREGKCMRWTALRLYIREWARQQPGMAEHHIGLDAWGVRARRGSWAI